MLRTIPTSPLFVRKISSSANPKRFTCEQSAAASRYSFVIRSSLNTAKSPDVHGFEFHGVVLCANLCGVQQETENLWVCSRRPSREQIQCKKHCHGAGQAIQQVEYTRGEYKRK